jgi:hypothetical protein
VGRARARRVRGQAPAAASRIKVSGRPAGRRQLLLLQPAGWAESGRLEPIARDHPAGGAAGRTATSTATCCSPRGAWTRWSSRSCRSGTWPR